MQSKTDAYWDGLKDRLSVNDWSRLLDAMGVNRYKMTQFQNATNDFSYEELVAFANFLGEDPLHLMDQYGFGETKITVRQRKQLEQQRKA